jgi:hypothetical protein
MTSTSTTTDTTMNIEQLQNKYAATEAAVQAIVHQLARAEAHLNARRGDPLASTETPSANEALQILTNIDRALAAPRLRERLQRVRTTLDRAVTHASHGQHDPAAVVVRGVVADIAHDDI